LNPSPKLSLADKHEERIKATNKESTSSEKKGNNKESKV
jgi:hypothetical protein